MWKEMMAMKRGKVLFIVEAMGGGVFTFMENLTNQLVNTFDVYVAYGIRDQTPEDYRTYFDPRIHLIEVKNFTRSIELKKDFGAFKEIRRIAADVKPDIIHLHSSKAGVLGRFAFDGRKTPMFYTPHGYSFLMKDQSAARKMVYSFLERICALRSCTTISCGESEHHETLKMTRRAVCINNGICLSELEDLLEGVTQKREEFTVCTIGRICQQKNPELFNEIALRMPDVPFVWVGDGDLRGQLTAPNITITGWKPRKEALKLAMESHVFVLTSLWEGLSIALLEAMCMHKVCIVHDIPGNNDVITDGRNGWLCGSADEFVRAIRAQQQKPDTEMMDAAYRDILEIYNEDVVARAYADIYIKAMKQ